MSEDRVCEEDTGSGFAHEPVPGNHVYRRAIQRVRMNRRGEDRETREDDQARSERTTLVLPLSARPLADKQHIVVAHL